MFRKIGVLLLIAMWGGSSLVVAAPDKDKNPRRNQQQSTASKTAADCANGSASADLNINNINARLFNTGSLFYSASADSRYEVPRGSNLAPIFAHNIWVGGKKGDALHMAAATYAQGTSFEFYPGPIDNDITDCVAEDRMYKVSRADITAYNTTGTATRDMNEWPYLKGAPVTDGDGNPDNYDLAAGDRPGLIGDQTIWFVMNDLAGGHSETNAERIGMEVQVTAFAFNTADALNNTTFYKYKFIYKPTDATPLTDTWIGLWSDPDLGDAGDDYVGSDTTLGLGFVYNGSNFDATSHGYGDRPPAMGYDFFQGPLVDDDDVDNNNDGQIDEEGERLKMTRFLYYNNENGPDNGNPRDKAHFFNYLQGRWGDGTPMTIGGDGRGGSQPTHFMFPGNPPGFWSEDNVDGKGTKNVPSDRRFLMSTGPFTMHPGDVQEVVFGIVWSQTRNRFGSVAKLKADDVLAQGAFDFDFNIPAPPDAPVVKASEMDGQVVLTWSNPPTSNNYLNQYEIESPFLEDQNAADKTYSFEGYEIYQFADESDLEGVLIATFDLENGVATVTDKDIDPETGAPIVRVVAKGSDSGVKDFLVIERDALFDRALYNFTEYHFGVRAYAYNEASAPKVRPSPMTRVKVTPQSLVAREGGSMAQTTVGTTLESVRTSGKGEGIFTAEVADPSLITGASYETRFFTVQNADEEDVLTFDIVNTTTGVKVLDGAGYVAKYGSAPPFRNDLLVAEGLSFSVTGPNLDVRNFLTVSNAAGPIDPPEQGTYSYNGNGFPHVNGTIDRPTPNQQANSDNLWGIVTGYDFYQHDPSYALFKEITFNTAPNATFMGNEVFPHDYEIRFTERGSKALTWNRVVIDVPFELWQIGIATPNDPSDDVRLMPRIIDLDENDEFNLLTEASVDAGMVSIGDDPALFTADHSFSGAANDPYTDGMYFIFPENMTPGEAGYNDLVTYITTDPSPVVTTQGARYGLLYTSLGLMNGGDVTTAAYAGAMPETGTTFRIQLTKPIAAGDVYALSTAGSERLSGVDSLATKGLDKIAVVPNPYRGASAYDVSNSQDQVRITNLPNGSKIKVYTVAGQLVFEDEQRSNEGFFRWDLRTEAGLPIASGMYLIHVEVPGVGDRILKFGVVKKRVTLDVL